MRGKSTKIPELDELIEDLRLASYLLPSEGDWVKDGDRMLPRNICTSAANLLEYMAGEIERMEKAQPTTKTIRRWRL